VYLYPLLGKGWCSLDPIGKTGVVVVVVVVVLVVGGDCVTVNRSVVPAKSDDVEHQHASEDTQRSSMTKRPRNPQTTQAHHHPAACTSPPSSPASHTPRRSPRTRKLASTLYLFSIPQDKHSHMTTHPTPTHVARKQQNNKDTENEQRQTPPSRKATSISGPAQPPPPGRTTPMGRNHPLQL
jgi:hypothetical protein